MVEPIYINNKPVITISKLSKAFGSNKVLDDFTVDLNKGENLVVLGRSGSGKSVLIKCVIGLLTPDRGSIHVFDEDVLTMDHEQLDRIRTRIGFLFQSNALYDSMTIRQNLEFPMRRHWIELTKQEAENRVIEALENVGLEHTIDMMPAELSGGMQKRVAIARTLILKPDIILYDEPTAGLDPITGKEISALMEEVQEKYQTSAIIISHDMHCVKATADRIAILINGKCYAVGTYSELAMSNDKNIKQFFE
jgi:phospholipid/cholesterol/gamma-HCH transport system ATP-binding protein